MDELNSEPNRSFPQQPGWESFWRLLQQQVARLWLEVVVPTAKVVGQEAAHWSTVYEKTTTVSAGLARIGWPPIHYEHQALHTRLAALFDAGGEDIDSEVTQAVRDYMAESGLDRISKDWASNPLLDSRASIIDDAIRCHSLGLWNAAVPVWYLLTEGIMMENLAPNKPHQPSKGERYIGPMDCFTLITTPHLPFNAWRAAQELSQKQAWCQYLAGPDAVSNSRHGVMHGGSVDYGTTENALKAMMLFDYVQEVLHYGIVVQDEIIHSPGCNDLRLHPSDLIFFQNMWWALVVGKVMDYPRCQQCRVENDSAKLSPRPFRVVAQRYNPSRLIADRSGEPPQLARSTSAPESHDSGVRSVAVGQAPVDATKRGKDEPAR